MRRQHVGRRCRKSIRNQQIAAVHRALHDEGEEHSQTNCARLEHCRFIFIILFFKLLSGAFERQSCYQLVLEEMQRLHPIAEYRSSINVLVTGAGLARLAWELRGMGFSVTGNEFRLFCSHFILIFV